MAKPVGSRRGGRQTITGLPRNARFYDARMRLVVWNANMAVHRKLDTVLQRLHPDVLVLCECADEATLSGKYPGQSAVDVDGVGRQVPDPPKKPDKGLAVDFRRLPHRCSAAGAPGDGWVVIADIVGPLPFSLIAVWAMNHRASNIKAFPQSNPQPAAALNTYWSENSGPTILAGDFNHNVSWDPGMPHAKQHARTLDAAHRAGLVSAYHQHAGEAGRRELSNAVLARRRARHLPYRLRLHPRVVAAPAAWRKRRIEAGLDRLRLVGSRSPRG